LLAMLYSGVFIKLSRIVYPYHITWTQLPCDCEFHCILLRKAEDYIIVVPDSCLRNIRNTITCLPGCHFAAPPPFSGATTFSAIVFCAAPDVEDHTLAMGLNIAELRNIDQPSGAVQSSRVDHRKDCESCGNARFRKRK
jgi:hypothetical protein